MRMAAGRCHTVLSVLLLQCCVLQAAKILTLCFIGASHYLLMDEVSRVLHRNGHDVRMFLQDSFAAFSEHNETQRPYAISSYSFDDTYIKESFDTFIELQKELLSGRRKFETTIICLKAMSYQCNLTLHQRDILHYLKNENYDIAIIEGFDPCTFLVVEKLGIPYIAFYPEIFINANQLGLPSPLSYVPAFMSQLSDRMDFFQRMQNVYKYFEAYILDQQVDGLYNDIIEEHFPIDSRPSLPDLYKKAELWIYNLDITVEFPRPLLPNIQYIGGLLAKPANPLTQDLEDFIADSGDNGFIVVSLGSLFPSLPLVTFLEKMNGGLARIPQKVIWRYKQTAWPKEVPLAPNVKILDWVPQNDLLAHPKARLLVTHVGMNSLMEAVYHGVPIVGIPIFGDQLENMVRAKARKIGAEIPTEELTAEKLANTIQEVIENESYKKAALKLQTIRRSQPFPPDQQLVRWVEHIIQAGGGGHLHPYSYQQPWYQLYLLDVILFLAACLVVIIYLIICLFRAFCRIMCSSAKQKQS